MTWRIRISSLIEAGLTVDAIAESIGVTPNAVREVIAGRTKAPRAEAAIRLVELCREKGVEVQASGQGSGAADPDTGRIVPVESA